MRLLVATPLYPPEIGGPATFASEMVRELPRHGISVAILPFSRVRSYPKIIRHIVFFFHTIGAGRGADAILALDPVSVGLPALFAARFLRKPFFVRIAGDYAWEQGMQRFGVKDRLDDFAKRPRGYSFAVQFLKYIERTVAEGAVKVVVPSRYFKGIVAAWGVPEERIAVVYSAAPEVPAISDRIVLRQRLFRGAPRIILSAGRLVPWKGFDSLINVASTLAATHNDTRLFIAGDGPERARLEALAAGQKAVTFLGALPQWSLFEYIAAADVFVLNSSYEGFSHQLLEVMAIGTPIIATAIGGNPELIAHEQTGLLIRDGDERGLRDAIARLLADEELSRRLALNARTRVASMTSARAAREVAEILHTP